ncbi:MULTISPECIES: conjugative transfer protein MobI(A/C) [Aeromonas]|jgi:hypothetical protein|uniref:Uncharacterized protein n=1 Tax=Aeromonas media TaxID=651 RepID=A0AAE6VQN9_AERME|nr:MULTISPECIES: conjugative transfer protein MobI(A/C) [Aeromonas]MBA8782017.1 hypothetical protein [Aeromonas caviae]MBA8786072.1 hypothetical protein [Aeromonas sp. TW 6]QHQ53629.1 hypothetical protein GWI30_22570 [Aeromonas media]QQQ16039.1 hypothetical protein JJL53_23485 [Aeromonas media]
MVQDMPVGPVCNEIAEPLREALAKASATVAEFAQVIIDRYWQEFRRKNQDQRHLPEDRRQLGRYAPNMRRHKANNKIYFVWRNYQPTRKGTRKGRILGVDIKPAKGLHYTEKQFMAYARPWEFSLIVRTERQLAALRELQEGIHKHIVHLAKCERVFEWKQQLEIDKSAIPTTPKLTEINKGEVRKTIAEYEAELSRELEIKTLDNM